MKRIHRSAIVEHAAAALYARGDDIESCPQLLPWCVAARVQDRTQVATRATLTVGVKGLRQSFPTQNDNRPGDAIDMRLVEGPFRKFSASWRFRALSAR